MFFIERDVEHFIRPMAIVLYKIMSFVLFIGCPSTGCIKKIEPIEKRFYSDQLARSEKTFGGIGSCKIFANTNCFMIENSLPRRLF